MAVQIAPVSSSGCKGIGLTMKQFPTAILSRIALAMGRGRTARIALGLGSILALVIGSSGISRARDDPFIPPGGAPDYVVTYPVVSGGRSPKTTVRTVSHHGDWTRIDVDYGTHEIVEYRGQSRRISMNSSRKGANVGAYFNAEWGENDDQSEWQTNARRTTEQRRIAGETCTVWLIRHLRDHTLERMSCLTEDGIEIASSVETDRGPTSATEASKVERRALKLDDVAPAQYLFDPAFWLKKAGIHGSVVDVSDAPSPNDEVVLIGSAELSPHKSFSAAEIHRRYGTAASNMQYRFDGGWQRSLAFGNRLSFAFGSSSAGKYRSLYIRQPTRSRTQWEGREKLHQAPDIIVGESCIWYDDFPGTMDASHHHCETSDGAVLEIRDYGQVEISQMLTAKSLRRGTNQLADVLPPSDLSDERQWRRPGDQLSKYVIIPDIRSPNRYPPLRWVPVRHFEPGLTWQQELDRSWGRRGGSRVVAPDDPRPWRPE